MEYGNTVTDDFSTNTYRVFMSNLKTDFQQTNTTPLQYLFCL